MGRPANPALDLIDKVEAREISTEEGLSLLEGIQHRITESHYLRARSVITSVRLQEESEERAASIRELFAGGWIHDYLTLAQFGESPDSFHVFSAMTILSHLLGRDAWSDIGLGKIYAPINAFLISPAGTARRSMAIRLAAEIGFKANANITTDTVTPEGLVQLLSDDAHRLLVVEETANLISKKEYQQSLIQNLCTLLDCPEYYQRTLRHEEIYVENPTLSFLTGCAPSWFRDSMPAAAGAGGLTSRMFMVYESANQRLLPFPEDAMPDSAYVDEMKKLLAAQAAAIATEFSGKLSFPTGQVKKTYAAFYLETDQRKQASDERLAPYYSRKPAHLRRVCLTMLAAEGKGLTLDNDILERSIALLDLIEPGMAQIYKATGMDKPGRLQSRVLRYIEKRGRASYSQILRAVSDAMSATELKEVLATLRASEVLRTSAKAGRNDIQVFYEIN